MPLRSSVPSHSDVARPCTRTLPLEGRSKRFTNRKRVVLPLPLRPRRTIVSPAWIWSEIPVRIARWALPFTQNETKENAIATDSEFIFAFISVDTNEIGRDYHTAVV